jgi:hypothetical protein
MGVGEVSEKIQKQRGFRGGFTVWAENRDEADAVMSIVADALVEEGLMFSWALD